MERGDDKMRNNDKISIKNLEWNNIYQYYYNIINNYLKDDDIISAIGFLSDETDGFVDSIFDNKDVRSRDLDILSVVANFLIELKEDIRSIYIAKKKNIYKDMDSYLFDKLEYKIFEVVYVLSTAEFLLDIAKRREEGLLMYITEQWIDDRGFNS